MSYKPQGYTSVAPYLVVRDAARTIEFLQKTFGALELTRYPDPKGGVLHAEVRIDDTVVMLADGNDQWPPIAANVHVYVPEVDEVYQRALENGATSVQAPVQKDDPDKRGGVTDPGGTTWWIATCVGRPA
jgi:PhnB protein